MTTSFKSPLIALSLALAALTISPSLQAATVTLQNPNFDSAAAPSLAGWIKSGDGNDSGSFVPPNGDTAPHSGTQVYLGTNVFGAGVVGQFIYQKDLIQVQPNTKYTLSLNVAGRTQGFGYGGYVAQIGVGDFNTEGSFRTLAVSNGAATGAFNKPFELVTFSFTTPSDLTSTTVRSGSQYDNTAATSQANITGQFLRIGVGMPLSAAGGQSDNTQTFIDTVSFDATAVPEPSTYALMGLSALGFVIFRRRKLAA